MLLRAAAGYEQARIFIGILRPPVLFVATENLDHTAIACLSAWGEGGRMGRDEGSGVEGKVREGREGGMERGRDDTSNCWWVMERGGG